MKQTPSSQFLRKRSTYIGFSRPKNTSAKSGIFVMGSDIEPFSISTYFCGNISNNI